MLHYKCFYHTHKRNTNRKTKGHQEILGGVGYVYCLEFGDDYHVQTHQSVHFKYVHFFVCQLYVNKAIKKGRKSN